MGGGHWIKMSSWMLVEASSCGLPRDSLPCPGSSWECDLTFSRATHDLELNSSMRNQAFRIGCSQPACRASPEIPASILVLDPPASGYKGKRPLAMPNMAKARGAPLSGGRPGSSTPLLSPAGAGQKLQGRVPQWGLTRDSHLAVALPTCLVAIWVKAFADITVAWTTCGVSPPATGARLVNPAERHPDRLEPPLPLHLLPLGSTTGGPFSLGCSSARLSGLRVTAEISPDPPTWSHNMAQGNLVNTRRCSRGVYWVFGYTRTGARMGSCHTHLYSCHHSNLDKKDQKVSGPTLYWHSLLSISSYLLPL